MIPRGHRHNLVPIAVRDRPDGSKSYTSRCNDLLIENDQRELVERRPGCGLEEERIFAGDGAPQSIRYRYGMMWFSTLDLLRLLPLPVEECATCRGAAWDPASGLPLCQGCRGLGVQDAHGPVEPPDLSVT